MILSSGILLHICVGAMLITPITSTTMEKRNNSSNSKTGNNVDTKEATTTQSVSSSKGGGLSSTTTMPQKHSAKYITAKLFSNYHFVFLMFSVAMLHGGTAVVFTHIVAFAESQGNSASFGSVVVSAIGFSILIGRILLGLLIQAPWVNAIALYTACVCFSGKYCRIALYKLCSVMGVAILPETELLAIFSYCFNYGLTK